MSTFHDLKICQFLISSLTAGEGKGGSLHWVIILCNEIKKLRLVTELYMQKWSDNLFAQQVYIQQKDTSITIHKLAYSIFITEPIRATRMCSLRLIQLR